MTAALSHRPLTRRQAAILDYIREYIAEMRYPPTIREIGDEFRIGSPNGIIAHLKSLERKGCIARDPETARGIRLLGPDESRPSCEVYADGVRLRVPDRLLTPEEACEYARAILEACGDE